MEFMLKCMVVVVQLWLIASNDSVEYGDAVVAQNLLRSIMDEEFGHKRIQEHFDNLVESEVELDGLGLLNDWSDGLQEFFRKIHESLIKLKDSLERHATSFDEESTIKDCCKVTATHYSHSYKTKINYSEPCMVFPTKTTIKSSFPPKEIQELMKENTRLFPRIHRQYFGFEKSGDWVLYPSQKEVFCDNYDPRYRPWYIEAVSHVPKDLVIVLDTSGTMEIRDSGLSLLQIAKDAIFTILKSLNPGDRIGIITFGQTVEKPSKCSLNTEDCYANKLALKTELNINCLKEFLDSRVPHGKGTNYTLALDEAFNFFHREKTEDLDRRNQLILFVSDGEITPGQDSNDILKTIRRNNERLDERVVLLTFGIGKNIDSKYRTLLKKMARQSDGKERPKKGKTIRVGEFMQIENSNDLRKQLVRYYNFFSKTSKPKKPFMSTPYCDILSSGAMITTSIPFFFPNESLAGVVGIDILLDEAFANLTSMQSNKKSYAFVVDDRRRVIYHPLLPRPCSNSRSIVLEDILSLEKAPKSKEIVDAMMRGDPGMETSVTKKSFPIGNIFRKGVDTISVAYRYLWRSIKKTPMSLCVVLDVVNEKVVKMKNQKPSCSFIYSRFDLVPQDGMCNYYDKEALINSSGIEFSPSVFRKKNLFDKEKLTTEDVKSWEYYFNGGKNETLDTVFHESVRPMVSATSIVNSIWSKLSSKQKQKWVWMYLSTTNGIMRVFPAVTVKKSFDHLTRYWFLQTIHSSPEEMVITSPFRDLWSGEIVISLNKGVLEGRSSKKHNHEDPVVAVLSGDFRVRDFHRLITTNFSICQHKDYSCIIVDSAGYIVSSDDHVNNKSCNVSDTNIVNIHLIEKEPEIANALLMEGKLFRKKCYNIFDIKAQNFWRMYDERIHNLLTFDFFSIVRIPSTNIYLIAKKNKHNFSKNNCWCQKDEINPRCSFKDVKCECPCYTSIEYDFCSKKLLDQRDYLPVCVPQPDDQPQQPSSEFIHLEKCYDRKCSTRTTQSECVLIPGCNFCKDTGKCTEDKCQSVCILLENGYQIALSTVPVIVIIVVTILLFCTGVFIAVRCIIRQQKTDQSDLIVPSENKYNRGQNNPAFDTNSLPSLPNRSSDFQRTNSMKTDKSENSYVDIDKEWYELPISTIHLPRVPEENPIEVVGESKFSLHLNDHHRRGSVSEYSDSIPSTFADHDRAQISAINSCGLPGPEEASDVESSINVASERPFNFYSLGFQPYHRNNNPPSYIDAITTPRYFSRYNH